jgi:hypothetical protein
VRNLLESRIGKEVDLQCEGAAMSGKVVGLEGPMLVLEKDDRQGYIIIEKIIAIWDKQERKAKSAGFLPKA